MKVAAVLSCWKQKLTSASNGEVLQTAIFSMFSGYLPSLYRSRVFPVKMLNSDKTFLVPKKNVDDKRNSCFHCPAKTSTSYPQANSTKVS